MDNTDTATFDKIAGIVTIASSACGICISAGALGLLGGAIGAASLNGNLHVSEAPLPVAAAGGLAIVVILFAVALSGLKLAGGIGVLQGRRWGFVITTIFCGLAALASLSGKAGMIAVVDFAICIYCILRLGGKIGIAP